uniref:Potassium/proton antiporter CemA n=1 Tax=Fritschiella tuberosa TaxID=56004 RepID=A0A6H1XE82_9CHLO|nr:chloroplast envelope membrane protein [Fritschiella tuberosa]
MKICDVEQQLTELEKIGLIPRSIVRMLDRFYYQIYLGTAEPLVKQFRFSKYLLLTSVKSLFVVLFIPFFLNILTKIYIFRPLVEYFWDTKQTEIFLNYELQEKAFTEIRNFEEKIYFDHLLKISEERRDEWERERAPSFLSTSFYLSPARLALDRPPKYEIFWRHDGTILREDEKQSFSAPNRFVAQNWNNFEQNEKEEHSSFQGRFVHESGNKGNLNSFIAFGDQSHQNDLWFDRSVAPNILGDPFYFSKNTDARMVQNSSLAQNWSNFEQPESKSAAFRPTLTWIREGEEEKGSPWSRSAEVSSFQEKRETTFLFSSSFSRKENAETAFSASLNDLKAETPNRFDLENRESIFRQKTRELAEHYNKESISALTNLLADFMGLMILIILLVNMKMSLMNTTAFLSESFFSLKDSKKAFLMLLFTDLLVGFHSPRGWEVIFHFLFEHFGLPENHNIIFLLVGTFPVLLDALFKYWIFRHLNRHSPATVATFQAMVE